MAIAALDRLGLGFGAVGACGDDHDFSQHIERNSAATLREVRREKPADDDEPITLGFGWGT